MLFKYSITQFEYKKLTSIHRKTLQDIDFEMRLYYSSPTFEFNEYHFINSLLLTPEIQLEFI